MTKIFPKDGSRKDVGSLIVGYDFTKGVDTSVLIVGQRNSDGLVDIINAFSGEEAEALYKKLTEKRKEERP